MEQRYAGEIRELITYLNMALPTPIEPADVATTEAETITATDSFRALHHPFQNINQSYQGLKRIHSDPDIYVIPDFLSTAECDRIIAKVQPHLIPCLVKNPVTGQVEVDTTTRTSSNANVSQREVPTLVHKLTQLLNDCSSEQLEILQVLHYKKGHYFRAHTDGFEGPTTACGFANSGRLVTIFCYLNHVHEGGQTRFPGLDLDIVPRQGMAVLHFPTTLGLEEDWRTEHEGLPAVDDKWLLVTWMWMHERSDAQYAESLLPDLSPDII